MPFTNFPHGFSNGISVRGMPILQTQPGQVYWVDNSVQLNPQARAGSDGNRGTYLDPFATLKFALTQTMPGRGDIVVVGAGHLESISSATTLLLTSSDVAILGMGSGASRPTFLFTTAATANIPVTGSGLSIQNCLFLCNFADVASVFTGISASVTASIASTTMTVTAVGSGTLYPGAAVMGTGIIPGTRIQSQTSGTTGGIGVYVVSFSQTFASGTITTGPQDFSIDSCEFRDISSVLNFVSIVTSSASAQAMAGLSFTNCVISSLGTTAATTAIKLTTATDRVKIADNFGCFAILNNTACMLAAGANNMTNFEFARNHLERPNTSSTGGSFISTSATGWTGHAYDNYLYQLDATAGIWIPTGTGGSFGFTNNYSPITGAVDKSALINPAAV